MKKTPFKKPSRTDRPKRFKRTEATRLMNAVLKAGLSVARIDCDAATGRITVFPGRPREIQIVGE